MRDVFVLLQLVNKRGLEKLRLQFAVVQQRESLN